MRWNHTRFDKIALNEMNSTEMRKKCIKWDGIRSNKMKWKLLN